MHAGLAVALNPLRSAITRFGRRGRRPITAGRCFGEAIQALVQSADEEGPALDAPDRAAQWGGEATFGVFENEVGECAGRAVVGQLVGKGAQVVGDGAGATGELECDLVVVRGVQARVAAPGEDGFDQAFVGAAVEGKFGFDVPVGVVEDRVPAHRCLGRGSFADVGGKATVWRCGVR